MLVELWVDKEGSRKRVGLYLRELRIFCVPFNGLSEVHDADDLRR
jgi:hypothetical protein